MTKPQSEERALTDVPESNRKGSHVLDPKIRTRTSILSVNQSSYISICMLLLKVLRQAREMS